MRIVWMMSWLSLGLFPVQAQTAPAPCQTRPISSLIFGSVHGP